MGKYRIPPSLQSFLSTPLALDPESALFRAIRDLSHRSSTELLTDTDVRVAFEAASGGDLSERAVRYAPILAQGDDQALEAVWDPTLGAAAHETPEAAMQAALRRPGAAKTVGVVAVIPIVGYIAQRASIWDEYFGSTSVEALRESIRAAAGNTDIGAIIIDVDSPGGTVAGVTELAQEIRALRGQKPIIAIANTTAASAAYWLAAQAEFILASPSAQVGSIGIYCVHQDISAMLEEAGIRTTLISAGPFKTEGNEYEPLSDEAKAHMQGRVDAFYDSFVSDVAKARNVSTSVVKADYGGGRVLLASDALSAGMIDAVGTLDDAIRRAAKRAVAGPMKARAEDGAPVLSAEESEELTFSARLAYMAQEAETLAAHGRKRAELRAKESRPAFGEATVASMRAIRDALTPLIALVDPAPVAGPVVPAPPADQPPPVPAQPQAAPVRRFRSDDEWLAHLTGGS